MTFPETLRRNWAERET